MNSVRPRHLGGALTQSSIGDTSTKDAMVAYSNMMLDPIAMHSRKGNAHRVQKHMRYPVNPVMCPEAQKLPQRRAIVPLHEFCKQRSIPFSENEDRFYKIVKQKFLMNQFKLACDSYEKVMKRKSKPRAESLDASATEDPH
jgi:hypothetical protein